MSFVTPFDLMVTEDPSQTDELQRANEVIGQFIASCSHSMRGPLKSIFGLVNLLRNPEVRANELEIFLDMIRNNTERMEHMLDEMEHFLENAQRKVHVHTVNSREAIEDMLGQQRHATEAAGVTYVTSVNYQAPCYCDRSRMSIILANLVHNAIQFRDEKKIVPIVNVCVEVNRLNTILTVSDNGIGIDSQYHKRIFELFFRGSQKSTGPGIGLYVVNQAVEKMNATITVQSIPDSGSTFTVTIPNTAKDFPQ